MFVNNNTKNFTVSRKPASDDDFEAFLEEITKGMKYLSISDKSKPAPSQISLIVEEKSQEESDATDHGGNPEPKTFSDVPAKQVVSSESMTTSLAESEVAEKLEADMMKTTAELYSAILPPHEHDSSLASKVFTFETNTTVSHTSNLDASIEELAKQFKSLSIACSDMEVDDEMEALVCLFRKHSIVCHEMELDLAEEDEEMELDE